MGDRKNNQTIKKENGNCQVPAFPFLLWKIEAVSWSQLPRSLALGVCQTTVSAIGFEKVAQLKEFVLY